MWGRLWVNYDIGVAVAVLAIGAQSPTPAAAKQELISQKTMVERPSMVELTMVETAYG